MVAGNDEYGVLKPRLLSGRSKEVLQSHISVSDDLIDWHVGILLLEHILIRFWHTEGVMTAEREQRRHEGLLHLRLFHAHILHKRLVGNAPPTVVVLVASGAAVGHEVLTAIILLKFGSACKSHKAHAAAFGTVEEGRLIAFLVQAVGQAADVVDAVRRQEERFDKHRYRRQNGGHAVNRLTAVAIGIAVGQCPVGQQRVCKGRIAFVARNMPVVGANVFATETLDDDNDYILGTWVREVVSGKCIGLTTDSNSALLSK